MKYSFIISFVLSLMVGGCASARQSEAPYAKLELISVAPLPPLKSTTYAAGAKLNFMLHVIQDGTVDQVKIIGSSGDAEWDSLALISIRHWKYDVPRRDSVPVDVWVRQPVVVKIVQPVVMTLGELVCASLEEADSLYSLLEGGEELDTLFKNTIETVDITSRPQRIRDELIGLKINELTRPIHLGDSYVIYKRFRKHVSKSSSDASIDGDSRRLIFGDSRRFAYPL